MCHFAMLYQRSYLNVETDKEAFLYVKWVPYQNVRLIDTGSDQSIRLVLEKAQKMVLRSEESLNFALDLLDAKYVVICASKQNSKKSPTFLNYIRLINDSNRPIRYLIITLR